MADRYALHTMCCASLAKLLVVTSCGVLVKLKVSHGSVWAENQAVTWFKTHEIYKSHNNRHLFCFTLLDKLYCNSYYVTCKFRES